MNNIIYKYILVPLLMLISIALYAQPYRIAPQQTTNFNTMQRQFLDWSADKELQNTKGWKYYKRWEYEMQIKTPLSGNLPDPNIFFSEAQKVADQKRMIEKSAGTWAPVGPMENPAPPSTSGIGRINCIAFHPTNANTFWVGVAQGGVWKTTNSGQTWTPLTDQLPIIRVSDIAVNPNNPDEIYISMGDYAYIGVGLDLDDRKRNTHYGIGIYKTTDGGQSWSPTGLTYNQTQFDNTLIRRVIIDPNNTDNLIAAGVSGIFSSTDAGATWSSVHSDIIWDIEQDPVTPNTLYASKGYIKNLNAGLGTSGIIKSTDFGQNWTVLPSGLPTDGSIQRIELTISKADPDYVYAVCCNAPDRGFYGVYRSTNAGTSWTKMSDYTTAPNILGWDNSNGGGGQGTYDLTIMTHPQDPETVYVGGINIWGSTDGGTTWNGVTHWWEQYGPSVHADQHSLAYHSLDDRFYICNDGGLYRTDSLHIVPWGTTWPTVWEQLNDNRMTSSFYKLGVSQANSSTIIAGAQDNSTYVTQGNGWINIIGGDGMDCIAHPTDTLKFYGSWQYGNLCKTEDGGATIDYGIGPSDQGEWVTPYMLDPNNSNIVYGAYGDLWMSFDEGVSWSNISSFPDIPAYGYPSPASAMDISPANSQYIYVCKRIYHGYDYPAELWVTTNGGTWNDRTAGLPDSLYFTDVEVSNNDENIAWVTMGGFVDGVKVFKTENAGVTWTNVSYNLPNVPVNNVEHEMNSEYNTVYVATDVGIYYLSDVKNEWTLYSTGLPNVICSDIELHYGANSIYIATFGRGIWKSDFATVTPPPINGVDELKGADFTLYPNPNDGNFSIALPHAESGINISLEIVNVMGQVFFAEQFTLNTDRTRALNVDIPSGAYYLKIKQEGNTRVRKFVVE